MIKAVIFDLDGTLLNTLTDISLAMNTVLHKHGFPAHSEQDYRYYVGRGVKNLITRALPETERSDKDLLEICHQELRQEYKEHQEENTRPYEGIEEMLQSLLNDNIRLAVLSNKPHDMTTSIVASLLGKYDFEQVRGARQGVPVKPDPRGVYDLITVMGLNKEEFLYVGDTDTDIQTARAAGLISVGVEWGFRERSELLQAGADYVVAEPVEIVDIIHKYLEQKW